MSLRLEYHTNHNSIVICTRRRLVLHFHSLSEYVKCTCNRLRIQFISNPISSPQFLPFLQVRFINISVQPRSLATLPQTKQSFSRHHLHLPQTKYQRTQTIPYPQIRHCPTRLPPQTSHSSSPRLLHPWHRDLKPDVGCPRLSLQATNSVKIRGFVIRTDGARSG